MGNLFGTGQEPSPEQANKRRGSNRKNSTSKQAPSPSLMTKLIRQSTRAGKSKNKDAVAAAAAAVTVATAIHAVNNSQKTNTSKATGKTSPPTQNTSGSKQQSPINQGGSKKAGPKTAKTVSNNQPVLTTPNTTIKQTNKSVMPVASVAPLKNQEQQVFSNTPGSTTVKASSRHNPNPSDHDYNVNAPNILPGSSNAGQNYGAPAAKRPTSYANAAASSQSYNYKPSAEILPLPTHNLSNGVAQTSHYEAKTSTQNYNIQTRRLPEWKYTGVPSTPLTSGLPDEQSSATGNWRYQGPRTGESEAPDIPYIPMETDLNGSHKKISAFKRTGSYQPKGSTMTEWRYGGDTSQPVEAAAEVQEAPYARSSSFDGTQLGRERSGRRLPVNDVNMPSGTKVSIITPSCSACHCTIPGANVQLITLEPNGKMSAKEYNIVANEMHQTLQHHNFKSYKIKKIQKVMNCCLWTKFRQREREIASEAGYVNERMLFHGSPAAEDIVRTGFDMSQAKGGYFGQGVYFAINSSKSDQYAGYVGYKKMLFCRVALGKMDKLKYAEPDYKGLPPGYHSVEGKLQVPEYVVYNDAQAYPEFLVHYDIVT